MEKGFYHPDIGYWQTITEPSVEIMNSYPTGTKEVPLSPGFGYEYNGTEWVPPSEQFIYEHLSKTIRDKREYLLTTILDPVVSNPLRWQSFTEQQKIELTNYRQALLDITAQPEFPYKVVWPEIPSFIK